MADSGEVALGSDLERKKWMREGLVQEAAKSFFQPYTGSSSDAIIYQVNNEGAADGHTVVFDFSGKITGKAIKGKDTAYGQGEIKRKFSDKITVARYRIPVSNGDKFDGVNIGDLTINEHSDSRGKLSDLFIRFKDQMVFDALQGGTDTSPSHAYSLGNSFTLADLPKIEAALKSGKGFKTTTASGAITTTDAGRRAPLDAFRLESGESIWLFLVDSTMAAKLKASADYQTIMAQADIRGNNNRLISGVIGKIGRLVIVEAPDFFGFTDSSTDGKFGTEDSEVELAGMRRYEIDDAVDTDTVLTSWEGETAFEDATPAHTVSRGLILGAGAMRLAFGKMPDYKFQESQDFAIDSESAVEFWTNASKTNLKLEGGAVYKQAKISGLDFGCIAVDMTHA